MQRSACSRREVLRREFSAGIKRILAVFLLGMPLICCRPSTREPVTLKYAYSWNEDKPAISARFDEFTRETGIRVKAIPIPQDTRDYVDLARGLLKDGSGLDLLNIDLIWSPILEPDLADLRPYLGAEIPQVEPQLLPSYTVNGKLVAVPFNAPLGSLEYRSDLLHEYGYDHPPKTWNELESMAERIQSGERAKGTKDFWGYVWDGAASEGLACDALEWQVSEGGGQIVEQDRTISVNNPAAIRSWQRARRWIGWISPPGVVAYRMYDTMLIFDSGKAAFNRVWLLMPITRRGRVRKIDLPGTPPVFKTGFSRMPEGPGGSASTLGGTGTAVSLHSSHLREAIALLRFQLRDLMQASEKDSDSGSAPVRFSDPPLIPWTYTSLTGSTQRTGIVVRPSTVAGTAYKEVSKAYIDAVHSVLVGRKDAFDAAAELEKQLIQITGFSTAPREDRQRSAITRTIDR